MEDLDAYARDIIVRRPDGLTDPIVAVHAEAMAEIRDLIRRAKPIVVDSDETFERADEINRRIREFIARLDRDRRAIKAPVLELGRLIDNAHKEATLDLKVVTGTLSGQLMAYKRQRDAECRLEKQKRREAAARQAEAEQRATEAVATGDNKGARDALRDVMDNMVVQPKSPELKSRSVVERTQMFVEIVDLSKIPFTLVHEGITYHLLDANRPAIRGLLSQGVHVPGCVWTSKKLLATKGG